MFKISQCNSEIVYRDPRLGSKEVDPTDFPRTGATQMTQSILVPRKQVMVLGVWFLQKISP